MKSPNPSSSVPTVTNSAHEAPQVSAHFSCYNQAEIYGTSKVVKAPWQSFGLAVFAGAFIALAFVFYLTVTTGAGDASWGLVRFVGGIAFSLGLILTLPPYLDTTVFSVPSSVFLVVVFFVVL